MSETTRNRILVVEDEDNLRELVRCRLEANGYEVAVAEDGYKALAGVRDFNPDLVILDLMLPKMDGYSVCRMLKSGGNEQTVPIILFTARSSDDDRRHGLDMGADAYVSKPFDPPVLLGKIRELLDPESVAAEQAAKAETETPPAEKEEEPSPDVPEPVLPEPEPDAEPASESMPETEPAPQPVAEPAPETAPPVDERTARVRPPAPEEKEAGDKSEPQPGFFSRLFRRLFGRTRNG